MPPSLRSCAGRRGRAEARHVSARFFILDNQYLASLIEVGLIGTLALVALLLSPYWFGRGARRRATSESDRNLGQMFAAAGASAAVAAATYDLLSFGMFSALLIPVRRPGRRTSTPTCPSLRPSSPLTSVASGFRWSGPPKSRRQPTSGAAHEGDGVERTAVERMG